MVRTEIFFSQETTILPKEGINLIRDRTIVERVPAFFGNDPIGISYVWIFEHIPFFRCRPIDGVRLQDSARLVCQSGNISLSEIRYVLSYSKPLARVLNSSRQIVLDR